VVQEISTAWELACEGRFPRGIRANLADPRWEAHLLRFLELSRAGRVVDEMEDRRAARLDNWILWEVEERVTV